MCNENRKSLLIRTKYHWKTVEKVVLNIQTVRTVVGMRNVIIRDRIFYPICKILHII